MNTIQATERETYEEMHCVSQYTEISPGETYVPVFLDMIEHAGLSPSGDFGDTILDAGCSSGRAAVALNAVPFDKHTGFSAQLMDITDSGLSEEARRLPFQDGCLWEHIEGRRALNQKPGVRFDWDWVYCCDVLEHIPPEFTMLAISRMLEAATKGVFLGICLIPDVYGAWVGKSLHQTVQSYQWWYDHLSELGEIVEARDLLANGVYLVRAKS